MHVRVSIGTAALLGLRAGRLDAAPTTLYLMLGGSCVSDCQYCAQASGSPGGDRLSRVVWPPIHLDDVVRSLRGHGGAASRICIQALSYPGMVGELRELTMAIRSASDLPVSASVHPVTKAEMMRLREAGVSWLGIAIDEACPLLFDSVRRASASMEEHWRSLEDAVDVFDGAALHLIAGMGETDRELVGAAERAFGMGAEVALFAYTRLDSRLPFKPPPPTRYRALQAAVQCLRDGGTMEGMGFGPCGSLMSLERLPGPVAYRTSGCPGCNRPYYNESPRGPLYNIPREPSQAEAASAQAAVLEYMASERAGAPASREGCT